MKLQVIEADKYEMLNSESEFSSDVKIYNLSEVQMNISLHPDYELHLYTVGCVDYLNIKSHDFYAKLKQYCSTNLNYTLMHNINNNTKVINIWITPIVTSA